MNAKMQQRTQLNAVRFGVNAITLPDRFHLITPR